MIEAFTLLVLLQLCGDLLAHVSGLPIPGPVVGLVLLLGLMAWLRAIPGRLEETADGLLSHLSLMLVPAGVGVVAQAALLASHATALALVVTVSTIATLAVTAVVFRIVARLTDEADSAVRTGEPRP
ncbi:MAG: CidA/LrgA family protein [Phreatobacter sp.]|nr:CidA/LrgA family protein [Phreatobacter sp.]